MHRKSLWDGGRVETRKRGIERHDWHGFILIKKCGVCFGTSEWGFKKWSTEGDSSRLEQAFPPNSAVYLRTLIVFRLFILIVIPNISKILGYRKSLTLLKSLPWLKKGGWPNIFPVSTQRRWHCVHYTLEKIFKIFCLNRFLLLFLFLSGQPSWPPFFCPNLTHEGCWSPWKWVEVLRQPGLACPLTSDELNTSAHLKNKWKPEVFWILKLPICW